MIVLNKQTGEFIEVERFENPFGNGERFLDEKGTHYYTRAELDFESINPNTTKSIEDVTRLIASERKRQIINCRYTPKNDDVYIDGQLGCAASCYAIPDGPDREKLLEFAWLWCDNAWKPTPNNRIKELVKAGALIVAEIERLQRRDKKL